MSFPRAALKLLTAGVLLASAGYSLRQLRELASVKKALSAPGATPEDALAALAGSDKSGVVRELIKAQLEQAQRLGALPGEGPGGGPSGAAAPEEPAEPPPSSGEQRLFTASRRSGAGSGTGVLIDHKTGERMLARPGVPRPAAPPLESARGAFAGVFSDDLRARRNRAYALLVGTVLVGVVLIVRARRALSV